jgi:hypothetical protein
MTKKKPTLREEVDRLREAVVSSENNQEMLEEALSVLETQLQEQGWIQLFGGGKELSKSALNTLYDLGRAYWLKNPLIRRSVEVQCLYVFGQGMTIKADNEPVDLIIQRFIKDRKNYTVLTSHQAWVQNERDLELSGNLFFALFTTPATGRVIVRTIPFYEVSEIITNPEDSNEPWYYKREFAEVLFNQDSGVTTQKGHIEYYPDWRYCPDDKPTEINRHPVNWDAPVYHVKTNCLPDMKFGVSELYASLDWAQAYKRFLENWGKLTEAYARFAWGITTKGGAAKVGAAKARMESLLGKTDPNSTGDLESVSRAKQLPVGGSFISTEGVQLNAIRTQGATTSSEDSRRLMLMVASASGVPEQILTGDPSTGNLATAKAMERPLELQFRNRQTLWMDVWWDLCQYIIDQAIKAGSLPGREVTDDYTEEITYILDDEGDRTVTVTFPPLLEHDVLQTVQAIISAATIDNKTLAGTMDRKTLAELLLKALKVENVEEILEGLPGEPQYDRITAPPAPDMGGFGGIDYTQESYENLMQTTIKEMQNAARKLEESDEGQWVTINGNHILLGDDGTIKQGFGKGKTPDEAFGKDAPLTGKSDKKPNKTPPKNIPARKPEEIHKEYKSLYQKKGLDTQLLDANYPDDELDSMGVYQGSGYKAINGHLRGDANAPKLSDPVEGHIKNINSAIDRCPAPDGMPLYRGVSGSASVSLENAKPGDLFEDKGFQSFSADPSQAKYWTKGEAGKKRGVMVQYITGPKDKALPLWGGEDPEESELEFLLKPGKFKVMGTTNYENMKVIQLAAA